jgi:hypothetical protein
VESSCEFGIEPSGSMKCWKLSSGLTSSGLSGSAQLHIVRIKTQILHFYNNQIFFIYNQVSLHVSANVGHHQVNTIRGVTISAGRYQCVYGSTQLKNTKNIKALN